MNTDQATWSRDRLDPLNEQVYAVFYTEYDGMGTAQDAFLAFRRDFFKQGSRSLRIKKQAVLKGFPGKIKGKMTTHSLDWKISLGAINIEETYQTQNGYVLVKRAYNKSILSKCYFDKAHKWQKSEYFQPGGIDITMPRIILTPVEWRIKVELRELNKQSKNYTARTLYPGPYHNMSPYQNVVDTLYGKPALMIYTQSGTYCYCTQENIRKRTVAMDEINQSPILMSDQWDTGKVDKAPQEETVQEGFGQTLEKAPQEIQHEVVFADMQRPATVVEKVEAPAEVKPADLAFSEDSTDSVEQDAGVQEKTTEIETILETEIKEETLETDKTVEVFAITDDVLMDEKEETLSVIEASSPTEEEDLVQEISPLEQESVQVEAVAENLQAAEIFVSVPEDRLVDKPENKDSEFSVEVGGLPSVHADKSGYTRIEHDGITVYEGNVVDGKRNGFGSYHYRDGMLCYTGFWKENKKDGLGVSFRHEDQALHVSNWHNGEPVGFVSQFDSQGNFKYGGLMTDGKKNGVGVSYGHEDKTLIVKKWEDGVDTGYRSVFREDGTLIYTGMWKNKKREGTGTSFDCMGEVLFTGEWKDGCEYKGIIFKQADNKA